jgi:restriction endonuclease Mrr
MLITTSTFTAGAQASATELGFELIDGAALAPLL